MATQKKQAFTFKGMVKDTGASKASSEYAYDIRNMRITATDESTNFCLVNEKGTELLTAYTPEGDICNFDGTVLGYAVINNYLVVFSTGLASNTIDKLHFLGDRLICENLYTGNLKFDIKYPIETLVVYENEEIQKVYWTDGLNQPRVINIAAPREVKANWTNTSFDFIPTLSLKENINVTKTYTASGLFAPGTIQYCFTYYNKYGQESNIFYSTPLYYTSFTNRGGSPEETTNNAFIIKVENPDRNFEYLRIYSVLKTSVNGTAQAKRVIDIKIPEEGNILYTDTGTFGETIDPTELLYIGGEDIVAQTFTQKDNRLFLGNIKVNKTPIDKSIKNYFRSDHNITFGYKDGINVPSIITNYWDTKEWLNNSSEVSKTFKHGETYRFGIQVQYSNGKWSDPIFIKDAENNQKNYTANVNDENSSVIHTIYTTKAYIQLNQGDLAQLASIDKAVKVRPVIVYPSDNDRTILCQGVLNPTVYNVKDRMDNYPFAQSSWFFRPNAPYDLSTRRGYFIYQAIYESLPQDLTVDSVFTITKGGLTLQSKFKVFSINTSNKKISFYPYSDDLKESLRVPYMEDIKFSINIFDAATPIYVNITPEGGSTGEYTLTPSYKGYNNTDITETNPGCVIMGNDPYIFSPRTTETGFVYKNVNVGKWAEFRHNWPIPSNYSYNSEIQCITDPSATPLISSTDKAEEWVAKYQENYYIDQSIVTLNSPELEFNDTIQKEDLSKYSFRVVGYIPIHASTSDIDITTKYPPHNLLPIDHSEWADGSVTRPGTGFYKEDISVQTHTSNWQSGWKSMLSGIFWLDEVSTNKTDKYNSKQEDHGFVVYPWHRKGSLGNMNKRDSNGVLNGELEHKKMSILRYSIGSDYFANAIPYTDTTNALFRSNELESISLQKENSTNPVLYTGNIEKVLLPTYTKDESVVLDYGIGYPIISSIRDKNSHAIFSGQYNSISNFKNQNNDRFSDQCTGLNPVSIKYKSTPHAVIQLGINSTAKQNILPTAKDGNITANEEATSFISLSADTYQYWDDNHSITGISQPVINNTINFGYLLLGEFYNTAVSNRFGGTTEEALANNLWLPCGEPVSLYNDNGSLKISATINYTEGDTYYQRYDCLKTYPFTLEDENSVVDILSFMCETRVNLSGRYDINKGNYSNLAMRPEVFNKVNMAYSQNNNFFNYRYTNNNLIVLNNYPNVVTWSKNKVLGEEVDTWTNITLASTLELDGDKGEVEALRRFNNSIISFQDKGISEVLYNENVQIAATSGVPIEIANSGAVRGKRYLTNSMGCSNKWSICETPNGLYFIDDNTKDIYQLGGEGFKNLSDLLGMHSWMTSTFKTIRRWDPTDFNGCITYYDPINSEVLFITKDECLAYSEFLRAFSGFYNYEHIPVIAHINDIPIAIDNNKGSSLRRVFSFYKLRSGEYNSFFGKNKDYSVTVVANENPFKDKVFNNLEFNADSYIKDSGEYKFNPDITFNKLEVWNEYQRGEALLTNKTHIPSTLKKKFRTWGTLIPRNGQTINTYNGRDRIRNPWTYIKLTKDMNIDNSVKNEKTILHNLIVDYFE